MLITQDNERLLFELTFDPSGSLVDVDFNFLQLEDIPDADIEKLKAVAETLRRERLDKANLTYRKIGRNEQCPCGSGKKYKKCCGA